MEEKDMLKAYREWILTRKSDEYTVTELHDKHDTIVLKTDYAEAKVSFTYLAQTIVELSIVDSRKTDEIFYIHFEFKDLSHAMDLFNEMTVSLEAVKERKNLNILICCTSALTSTYFADKLNKEAERRGINWCFRAVSANRMYEPGNVCDVILLAPQIAYQRNRVAEIMKDTIVLSVPGRIFGSYDTEALFRFVEDEMKAGSPARNRTMPVPVALPAKNQVSLYITVLSEFQGKQIIYRVYNNGKVCMEDRIRKVNYGLRDIEDVIDVVLSKTKVDSITVCTPGVVRNGVLTFREANIIDVEVEKEFSEKYSLPVVFCNDANAMALGWYSQQEKYRNVVFYFHPHAARVCGTGSVIDGKLNAGHSSIAGEMQFLVKALHWSKDPGELALTPEGTLELVTGYLTALIAGIDPEVVVIYCDMVPDMGELRSSIGQYIRSDCIPLLVKADDVVEYMFAGSAAYRHSMNK